MANWLDLPQELLERISEFCSLRDQFRMHSICKSWQSILKNSIRPGLPRLMIPKDYEHCAREIYCLSKQKIHTIHPRPMHCKDYCWSFQIGWLMEVDWCMNFRLFHPWVSTERRLPYMFTLRGKYFTNWIEQLMITKDVEKFMENFHAAQSDDGNMVMVIIARRTLGFCRIGDEGWTCIEAIPVMADVVYHRGQFYFLSVLGDVYLLHFVEGFKPQLKTLSKERQQPRHSGSHLYLVPDILTDALFVIDRKVDALIKLDEGAPCRTDHFDIYKIALDLNEREPEGNLMRVKSLGDRVLFLGRNSPMIVVASEFPGFKRNHIYYAYDIDRCYRIGSCRGYDTGVFNVMNGSVERLFTDRFHYTYSPPLWIAAPGDSSAPCSLDGESGDEEIYSERWDDEWNVLLGIS